jgi:hypothetical protein
LLFASTGISPATCIAPVVRSILLDLQEMDVLITGIHFSGVYEGLKETIAWFEDHYPDMRK